MLLFFPMSQDIFTHPAPWPTPRMLRVGGADVRGAGVEAQLTLEVEKVQTLAKSTDALRIWKDMLTIS